MADFKNDGSASCPTENWGIGCLTIFGTLNGQNHQNPTIRGWGYLLYLGPYSVSAFYGGDSRPFTRIFTSYWSDHLEELEKALLLELARIYFPSAPASPSYPKLEVVKPSSEQ